MKKQTLERILKGETLRDHQTFCDALLRMNLIPLTAEVRTAILETLFPKGTHEISTSPENMNEVIGIITAIINERISKAHQPKGAKATLPESRAPSSKKGRKDNPNQRKLFDLGTPPQDWSHN